MIVRLPNWISSLSGWNNGLVFYGYKEKYGICYSRDYVYPTLTANNVTFGIEGKAVSQTTWLAADSSFQEDMQTYADAWDETQQPGRELIRTLTDLNLFVKAVFEASDVAEFDLSTLTVANFGGEIGDLLGTATATVGHLIEASGLPSCGLDLDLLNSPIEAA